MTDGSLAKVPGPADGTVRPASDRDWHVGSQVPIPAGPEQVLRDQVGRHDDGAAAALALGWARRWPEPKPTRLGRYSALPLTEPVRGARGSETIAQAYARSPAPQASGVGGRGRKLRKDSSQETPT